MEPTTPNPNSAVQAQNNQFLQQSGVNTPEDQQKLQFMGNMFSSLLNRIIQEANSNANNGN